MRITAEHYRQMRKRLGTQEENSIKAGVGLSKIRSWEKFGISSAEVHRAIYIAGIVMHDLTGEQM